MSEDHRKSILAYHNALKAADQEFMNRLLNLGLTKARIKRVMEAAKVWSLRRTRCGRAMNETRRQVDILDEAVDNIEPPIDFAVFMRKRANMLRTSKNAPKRVGVIKRY